MRDLRKILKRAEERGAAIGHFNVADFVSVESSICLCS
jgi:hypothetical protein